MQLIRSIADSGKTVVCVTHTLANIFESCHLVVPLTLGRKLAFVGTPAEVVEYFGISRPGLVYEVLADPECVTELQEQFAASDLHRRYIQERLSPGAIPEDRDNELQEQRFLRTQLATMKHQLSLLSSRYLRVVRADRRAFSGQGMQVLIIAVVLYLVFGEVAPSASAPALHFCFVVFSFFNCSSRLIR